MKTIRALRRLLSLQKEKNRLLQTMINQPGNQAPAKRLKAINAESKALVNKGVLERIE